MSEPARVLVIWTAFLSPAPVRTATVACSWRAAAGSGEENPGSSNTASAQSMYRRTSRLCFSGECWNKPLVEILVHTSVPSDDSEILSSVVFFISDVLEAEGWWYPSISSNQNYSIICLVALRTVSFSLKFGAVVTSILSKSNSSNLCGVTPACTGGNWSSRFLWSLCRY